MKHMCVQTHVFLVAMFNDELSDIHPRWLSSMVSLVDENNWPVANCSRSHEHPHLQPQPLPPALGPRKRFIVQAGSESREAWFWLAHCAASETLTFLQGLHLELVSCSGYAGQGRHLAQLCDWAELSLYGPQNSWNCQTVIRQSLAYRFKPEQRAGEKAYDWCRVTSKKWAMF